MGSVDGKLRIYDMRAGQLYSDDRGFPITCVRAVNDNKCALVACLSQSLHLSEIATGTVLKSYTGHVNRDYKIECGVTFDDQHVVSGSEDGSLFIWNLLNGQQKRSMKAHYKCLSSLSCHPSKDIVVTASADGTAKSWINILQS